MSANDLAKSAKEKDQNDNDLCKKHTTRCDKDYNRSVCPSKLSKRELEDLYYSLLDNNLELKRTINTLNEKNRILSTKVQRIAAQTKTYMGMGKDCCATGKAVINEQKAALADLTKANEVLADRVRRLSTQLCTAKQFLKQNPNGRLKCYSNTSTSVKNLSTTSLQKSSNVNLKSAAASAIQLDQEPPTTRTAETNTLLDIHEENNEKEEAEKVCSENRCRTTMEQLKEKIGDLEEELAKTHAEYSTRMTQLESQVSQLQATSVRARGEVVDPARERERGEVVDPARERERGEVVDPAREREHEREREALERARHELRKTDVEKAELETRLSIEKKRVAELEMRLKAADLSRQVAQTVEEHLNTACRRNPLGEQLGQVSKDGPDDELRGSARELEEEKQLRQKSAERSSFCCNVVTGDISHQPLAPPSPTKTPNQLTVPDDRVSKSDDSGYADHRQETDIDDKDINQANQELIKKIEELQAQLDALKSISTEKGNAEQEASPCPKSFDQYYIQSEENQEIKDNEKVLPKRTQISICEPAVRPSKELITEKDNYVSEIRKSNINENEINTPPNDKCPSKEEYERNNPDFEPRSPHTSLTPGVSNLYDDNDTSDKEQGVGINTCITCECYDENRDEHDKNVQCKKHSIICAKRNTDKENNLVLCSSRDISDHEEVTSISLVHVAGSINKKPGEKSNLNDGDNDSVTSSTMKRKRVSLVVVDGGSDNRPSKEIRPTSPKNVQKDLTPVTPKVKAHNCNIQQIPGPLPVSSESTGKRRVSRSDKKPEYYGNTKYDGQNKDKAIVMKRHLDRETKNHQDKSNNVGEYVNMKDNVSNNNLEAKDVYDDRKNKGLVIEVQYPEGYKQDEENDLFIRNQEKLSEVGTPLKVRSNVMTNYKGAKDILKDENYRTESFQSGNATKISGITRINEFDICQHHATICTCPEKPSPSLTLFRSCSGSQTLATLPLGGRFRRCSCSERPSRFSCGSVLKDKPMGTSTPKVDRATPTSPHTYTIDSGKSRADSPANSPANTDNEISVMTDLPSEKDDTYDRLSPGEQRPTATSTDTCSLRYGPMTLSEGEVPRSNYEDHKPSKCLRRTDYEKQINLTSYGEAEKSPTEKMEATLRAISRELARCRSLLLSQRPTELKNVAAGPDRETLPLRKTVAKSRIDGTALPTCLFIMHVVSVVFSDEAVLRSHDTRLMLSWQFADCKPTVIALGAGRVVHFDFSTQHELQMTKEVVDYLKMEDLSLVISEIGNAKKNFASCVLPLRQVLLNVNSRIDLSLPLKAGPYLTDCAPGTTNVGEDVGVLDVWCMLVCEDRQMSATNHSIAQSTETLKKPSNSEQTIHKNPNKETETIQQKPATRKTSFQRQKFMVPSDENSSPQDTITNIEGRHQVGFEEPYGHEKKISLLQCYEKDGDTQGNSNASLQQHTMMRPKSRFSKVPDDQVIDITVLWLTLNENCDSMVSEGRKLYVAYTFLGRSGAELETPVSLPKPQRYTDKCIFNFRKSFVLTEMDMRVLEHMVSCRSQNRSGHNSNDCIVFTVVSEPPEDPLGLDNCEDIGFAFLYLGDMLAYCNGNSFTEALPVRGACAPSHACGVLAVRVDGLDVLRACKQDYLTMALPASSNTR